MDVKAVDAYLCQIIEKKAELSKLSYSDKKYDKIEEELHNLEDDFLDQFGDEFEEILEVLHENLKSRSDILLPIAYLGNTYTNNGKKGAELEFDAAPTDGTSIDTPKFVGKNKKLILIPCPLRLVLQIDGKQREVVWKA